MAAAQPAPSRMMPIDNGHREKLVMQHLLVATKIYDSGYYQVGSGQRTVDSGQAATKDNGQRGERGGLKLY